MTGETPFWDRCDRSGGDDACWPWLMSTNDGAPRYITTDDTVSARLYAVRDASGNSAITRVWACPKDPLCVNPRHLRGNAPAEDPAVRFDRLTEERDGHLIWIGRHSAKRANQSLFEVDGKTMNARKFQYERHHGVVPAGLVVTNSCNVDLCVHPDHLVAVSRADAWKLRQSSA